MCIKSLGVSECIKCVMQSVGVLLSLLCYTLFAWSCSLGPEQAWLQV